MKDYEAMYFELVDALCSKSWEGRSRHPSVVALAKRLRDSRTIIRPMAFRPMALQFYGMVVSHDGPCSGMPRHECPGFGKTS
jgi:hypothetical protein